MTARDVISEIMRVPDRSCDTCAMTPTEVDEYFMSLAMGIARGCGEDGEVPVGAVAVRGSRIISCGANGREGEKNALSHAELNAISAACTALGGWRLTGVTLYVTLEPCAMCAGAVINAHIPRVVYAAKDARAGAMGSIVKLQSLPLGYHPLVEGCERYSREAAQLLREFFYLRRLKPSKRLP